MHVDHKEENIESFWNENPVGTNFIDFETGKEYFEQYDIFRYTTEGHILKELDSIDFNGKKTLEIGLGQGADSMQIAKRGALYNGIDLTEESVRRVKQRFEIYDLEYEKIQKASARNIPFDDNTFDIVYSHGVIHHSPHIEEIVSEIYRVLKPGGQVVLMLYHKDSFNYNVSIKIIRRVGLLVLRVLPILTGLVSKLTGEGNDRIRKHITNMKSKGMKYLSMENFIHVSTDGPDNVYSTVWNEVSADKLLSKFENLQFSVHFLNQRHLMGLQYLLTKSYKQKLDKKYGWHLWVKGVKSLEQEQQQQQQQEQEQEQQPEQISGLAGLSKDIDLKKNLGCG